MQYIIAKSTCESILSTKSEWDSYQDDLFLSVHEFEAESPLEAEKYYEEYINPSMWRK